MKLLIAAVGRGRGRAEHDLARAYLDRLDAVGRQASLHPVDLAEVEEKAARAGADLKTREGALLTGAVDKHLPAGARLIALDEGGKNLTSRALADQLARWRDGGVPGVGFLIGGADGLDPDLTARADTTLAFGKATWPHMMVRAMLAEQLYRAATLLTGHPYHRD